MAEILSPAGGYEQAEAAVRCGADAVYIGLKSFSARASACNFDEEDLRRVVSYCHTRGVRVHAAVNTMVFDDELPQLAAALKLLAEVGVDAVISQDLAVAAFVKECCPRLPLHASTQMTLHTAAGMKFAADRGFERAVLSRELPARIIKEITRVGEKLGIETEVFVHGALCMSVSGQCAMSALAGGRSANRGECAQPCRLPCSLKKGGGDHALSLSDMSHLHHIPELEKAGAASFKIEGRMKRPEYVALATYSAVQAARGESYDERLLADVFSRGGFTDGYYTGKLGREMFGRRTKDDAAAARAAYPAIHELYRREVKRARLSFFVKVSCGEPLEITAEDENGLAARFVGDIPETARSRPCDEEFVRRQLSKTGDGFYEMGELKCEIGEGLALPASALNKARRELTRQLDEKRREFFSRSTEFDDGAADRLLLRLKEPNTPAGCDSFCGDDGIHYNKRHDDGCENSHDRSIYINLSDAAQLAGVSPEQAELVFLPLRISKEQLLKAAANFPTDRIGIAMPRFTFDEQGDIEKLRQLTDCGVRHILCTNFAHFVIAEKLGLTAHGGAGLNTANSAALEQLLQLGAADAVISPELHLSRISKLRKPRGIRTAVTIYGRLPMMLTVNCPVRAQSGDSCKSCRGAGRLYDRTGRELRVKCSRVHGYVELLNPDTLCVFDKLRGFAAADIFLLEFFDESPDEIRSVLRSLREGTLPERKNGGYTRGLYYRKPNGKKPRGGNKYQEVDA